MTNPNDLTGRDLNLALAAALQPDANPRIGLRYADLPELIPELFAEIRKRTGKVGMIALCHSESGFVAESYRSVFCSHDHRATGSTPSEALARLLLMVVGR